MRQSLVIWCLFLGLIAACSIPKDYIVEPVELELSQGPPSVRPNSMMKTLFTYNQRSGQKHTRCGMCHIDIERGILQPYIEQKTKRTNPFTDKPFDRIEAICTSCHTALHMAHPVGITPNPAKVILPAIAKGFRGEEENLTCMGCHDWHPTNKNYKYLRWPTDGGVNISKFCVQCHPNQGRKERFVATFIRGRPAPKVEEPIVPQSRHDPYFLNPTQERSALYKSYQGALFNLDTFNRSRSSSRIVPPKGQTHTSGRDEYSRSPSEERIIAELNLEPGGKKSPSVLEDEIAGYQQRIERNPQDSLAYFRQGLAYVGLERWSEAISSFNKVISLRPDYIQAYLHLGEIYYKHQEWDKAQTMFQQSIRLNANFPEGYLGLAKVYREKGLTSPAIEAYEISVDKSIDLKKEAALSEAHYNLGLLYKKENQLDKAKTALKKAVDTSSKFKAVGYYQLGLLLKDQNEQDKAQKMFSETVAIQANHQGACYEMGLIHKQRSELGMARTFLQRAVDDKSGNPKVYYELGEIAMTEGKPEEAASLFKSAIKLAPDDNKVHFKLGSVLLQNGKTAEAVKEFSRVKQGSPEYREACFQQATAYFIQKKYDQALSTLTLLVRKRPDYQEAYLLLGKVYLAQNDPDKAILSLNKALGLQSDLPAARYLLSKAYRTKGLKKKADRELRLALNSELERELGRPTKSTEVDPVTLYQAVLRLDPMDAEASYNLGLAYMGQGKLAEAVQSYRQAIILKPKHAGAYYHLGLAYKSQDDEEKAISSIRKALECQPDFRDARYSLADMYHRQNRYQEAISEYQRVTEGTPGSISYLLGAAYLDKWQEYRDRDDLRRAEQHFRKTLEANPQHPDARVKLTLTENLLSYKIQVLLVSSPARQRVKQIWEQLREKMPYKELSRISKSYPTEAKVLFALPDELMEDYKKNLQELENGQMSNIFHDGKNYALIYRINSL